MKDTIQIVCTYKLYLYIKVIKYIKHNLLKLKKKYYALIKL